MCSRSKVLALRILGDGAALEMQGEARAGEKATDEAGTSGLLHHMHALGQGIKKYASEDAAPTVVKQLLPKRSFARRRRAEFYSLPAKDKVCVRTKL